ncbi:MAG: SRPBCC domain-containing protein [Methanomassiliicoccus sp.]|nr:SRPBCC domain-containing protein [Methanomassiliicoccus sp.]
MTVSESLAKKELLVSRVLHAPREDVWKAYTQPDQVKQWWGPRGFTAPVIESELRPGGRYLYCMRAPNGKEFWSAGVFREFSPPERIVATDSFADREGNIVPASYYGLSDKWPLEDTMVITFEEEGDGTRVTVREPGVPPGEDMDNAIAGWNESFDKLAELVEAIGGGCRERVHGGERREED